MSENENKEDSVNNEIDDQLSSCSRTSEKDEKFADSLGSSIAEDNKLSYDEAVRLYGSGRYQIFIIGLLIFSCFPSAFNNNGYIFIGAFQNHTCQVPGSRNWTDPATNRTVEVFYTAGMCTYTMEHLSLNGSKLTSDQFNCDSWNYDTTYFQSTVTSEWDLNNCRGKWQIALGISLYMLGVFIGCFILADFSDRFGRKKTLVMSSIAQVIVGVVASFSVNMEMLMAMRTLLGFFTAGTRNAGFAQICEITPHRIAAGIILGSFYCLGGVLVTAISHLLPNWRYFQLACALCYLLFIPYYWILPESPRWLLSQGRTEEAMKYFKQSARINKVEIPENISVYLQTQTVKSEKSILVLFKYPNLRRVVILCAVIWFNLSAAYFGVQYNAGNLSGNIFTNNYLIQAIGMIEFVFVFLMFLNRKPVLLSGFVLAALFSGLLPVLNHYDVHRGYTVAFAVVGKVIIQTLFDLLYIIVSELFPTTVRTIALGFGSASARLGGAASPYIVLSHDLWPTLPYIIFAGLSMLSGFLTVFLPETKGRKLPDSIEESELVNQMRVFDCIGNSRPGSINTDQSEPDNLSMKESKFQA